MNKIGSFFLLPLYWKKLSPSDYGVLAVVAMVGLFQTLLGTLSLDLSITRYYYQWKEEERRRNLGAVWIWSWIGSIATTFLGAAILWKTSTLLFPDIPFHPYLLLGMINTGVNNLFIIPFTALRMRRLPWLFAGYNLGNFLVTSGLGIWLVVGRSEGLWGFLVANIIANSLCAVFGVFVMLRMAHPCFTAPGLKDCIRFALPALPSNVLGTLTGSLDRFLLNYFASLETLGIYAVAMRFVEVMNNVHNSLKMVYGPFMMKNLAENKREGVETVCRITPFYIFVYFIVALGLALFVRDFVHFAGKHEYFPVIQWVPWLAGISLLSYLYNYYTNGLFLANKTSMLSIPALANLAALAITAFLLIKKYQLGGLIASRYCSGAVFFGTNLYLSQKVFPLPHHWKKLIGLWISFAIFAFAGSFVHLQSALADAAWRLFLFVTFIAGGTLMVVGRQSLPSLAPYLPKPIARWIAP